MARGKRDCVYGRGPILTRESIRMAIGSSDLFPVALVGCQCLCMASKRRVALYLFLSGKILWRSIPSRSDASHTAGQGLNNRFLVMHFWFFFSKSNWRRRREKVQVGVLFVCRVFVYNSKSIRTYIPAVPTRECTILFIVYLFAISFTIKIKVSKPERTVYIRPYTN